MIEVRELLGGYGDKCAVTGFLGPSGSGKSTTSGTALMNGQRNATIDRQCMPTHTVGALLDTGDPQSLRRRPFALGVPAMRRRIRGATVRCG
jgi:ABC-type glutathione transport system ATPase component